MPPKLVKSEKQDRINELMLMLERMRNMERALAKRKPNEKLYTRVFIDDDYFVVHLSVKRARINNQKEITVIQKKLAKLGVEL